LALYCIVIPTSLLSACTAAGISMMGAEAGDRRQAAGSCDLALRWRHCC
jgi:hypothetical protein